MVEGGPEEERAVFEREEIIAIGKATAAVGIPPEIKSLLEVRGPTTWTVTRHYGPDHLGL